MAEYPSVCLRPVVLNPCEKNATRSLRNFNSIVPIKNCFLPYTILFYLSIIKTCDSQISFNFPKGQLFVSLSFFILDQIPMTPPNYPINLIPRQDFRKEKEMKEEPLIRAFIITPVLVDIPIKFGISPRQRRDASDPSTIHPYRFRNDSKFVTGSRYLAAGSRLAGCLPRIYPAATRGFIRCPPANNWCRSLDNAINGVLLMEGRAKRGRYCAGIVNYHSINASRLRHEILRHARLRCKVAGRPRRAAPNFARRSGIYPMGVRLYAPVNMHAYV